MLWDAGVVVLCLQQEASNSSSSASASASTSGQQEDFGQKVVDGFQTGFEQAKTGYQRIKSKINATPESQPLLQQITQELKKALLPHQSLHSPTKRYTGPVLDAAAGAYDGPAALVVMQEQKSAFEQAVDKVRCHGACAWHHLPAASSAASPCSCTLCYVARHLLKRPAAHRCSVPLLRLISCYAAGPVVFVSAHAGRERG